MISPSHYSRVRHDLRTYLNHIMGYGDILIADAKEYGKTDYLPAIDHLLQRADNIKRLIQFHFDVDDPELDLCEAQEIRKALFSPIAQMIGDSRRLLGLFRAQAPQFIRDMEQLLAEASHMHELIESELVDIELLQLSRCQDPGERKDILPESTTILSDDSIQGQMARMPARVLVIDDSLVYHRLIQRHLVALGHTVTCSSHAQEALDLLGTKEFDIIILDVLMPDVPGSNLLRTFKADPVLSHIPVIMMSALADSASIAQCIRLGAEDYLKKDSDPVILKARIDACMEKQLLQQQQRMYMEALSASQKALANELGDAAEYVVGLLPSPLDGTLKASVELIPSAQLGGDFCNFHWLDNDHICFYLLDVGGHGVKASLLAVSISNTMMNKGIPGTDYMSPAAVLNSINKAFQKATTQSFLFCMWYGVYELSTSTLRYAGGGSPPACITHSAITNRNTTILESGDLVLGAMDDYEYTEYSVPMTSGDRLFIYSDGLYEVSRPDGTMLGLDDFQKLLPLLDEAPAENIHNLLESILTLTKNSQYQDDVSIISVEF